MRACTQWGMGSGQRFFWPRRCGGGWRVDAGGSGFGPLVAYVTIESMLLLKGDGRGDELICVEMCVTLITYG